MTAAGPFPPAMAPTGNAAGWKIVFIPFTSNRW